MTPTLETFRKRNKWWACIEVGQYSFWDRDKEKSVAVHKAYQLYLRKFK